MTTTSSIDKALALIESDASKILGVKVGTHEINKGTFVPKADAQNPPSEISFASANIDTTSDKSYVIVALDLDAPFPSAKFLSPIVHWIQPGFKPSPSADNATSILKSESKAIFNYIPPSPPPISAPHRYVFFLYRPVGDEGDLTRFSLKDGESVGIGKRVRVTLNDLEKKYGLGECLGCNYFNSK